MRLPILPFMWLVVAMIFWSGGRSVSAADGEIDFNRDIRPILSNNCFQCHGPDEAERKGGTDGLRLDTFTGATVDLGGYQALSPGQPEQSEMISRLVSTDPDLVMPPRSSGKKVTPEEIQIVRRWIQQGANYAQHWSYVIPVRPELPQVQRSDWPRNPIDRFILARLEQVDQAPAEEADRSALARRVALDLTGLPPTLEELKTLLQDAEPDAYDRFVDRLLQKQSFGEHWARMWLDLARYADSAGYADDPARSIWLYRDYVIRSFNENKPFDQFTIEQIAGDLLPHPTPEQLIATAFHRNTLTNSEGGTNDEEFRNVAIVDRVNTTFSVWMGTTMACAQCHTHKFDPITQSEYFSVFAILNNTADADRRDEAPLFSQYQPVELEQKSTLEKRLLAEEQALQNLSPEVAAAMEAWDSESSQNLVWQPLHPSRVQTDSGSAVTLNDGLVAVAGGADQDLYTVTVPVSAGTLQALQLEVLPDAALPEKGPGYAQGNFVITQISARLLPPARQPLQGRFIRISLPGENKLLSLAEVQVFQGDKNLALAGAASQISTDYAGNAELAIDGSTNGDYFQGKSVTHTALGNDPWWELDLLSEQQIDHLRIWNRTDGGTGIRLVHFQVEVLDAERNPVWKKVIEAAPQPEIELDPTGGIEIQFAAATADYSQAGFPAENVLAARDGKNSSTDSGKRGWAIAGGQGAPHTLTLLAEKPMVLKAGWNLQVEIQQKSNFEKHTLGRFRLAMTESDQAAQLAKIPPPILAILQTPREARSATQTQALREHFVQQTPLLAAQRTQIENLQKQIAKIQPATVPICKELPAGKRRETHVQLRGNYLELGQKVEPGIPVAFSKIPDGFAADRLGLAHWLVSPENPLTARVIANRYWEQVFGIGLVSTSEDFGSQGDVPSHPELLDWLATELVRLNWDTKALLKLIVTSSTYRQSSRVTPESNQADPDNRLLARGPRFRLSAEMIRDQALFLAGLLSDKAYGPPVRPPQPRTGLNAAFGGAVDWATSTGEDRYRRGIYTSWRRSNPYPSMATFDAPNREVCTVRRVRTNTPLQALVTLNDPVFIEAAQSLARRVLREGGQTTEDRATFLLQLCLARAPHAIERAKLVELHAEALAHYTTHETAAQEMATVPLGEPPSGMEITELATWTVLANVVLNLDEVLMKR